MITTAPKVLVTAIICTVVAAAAPAPALADDCSVPDGASPPAECQVRKTLRRSTVRGLAAQMSALPQDDEISASLIEPPLAFDIDANELFRKFDRGSAIPGTQLVQPSSSGLPRAPSDVGDSTLATWSKLEKDRLRENAHTSGGVGVSYQPSRTATFGVAAESEQNAAGIAHFEQSKMAATFGLKTSPLLSFEAKAAWARQSSGDVASRGTQSGQNEVSARINGDWRLGVLKVAPNVSVAHATEGSDAESAKTQKGTFSVAPTLSRPFTLNDQQALEPYLRFKQEIDISAPTTQTGTGIRTETRSLGGGVKLQRKDDYSLSLSTDIENLDAERHPLKSEFRLNVPLR